MKSHDFSFVLPGTGSSVTLQGRSLDDDELNVKLKYDSEETGEVEGENVGSCKYVIY